MVDAGRVRSLLDRLSAAHRDLRRLQAMERGAVRDDVDRLNSVKYLFVIAAEICIDIGNHVIAAESLRAPESYAQVDDDRVIDILHSSLDDLADYLAAIGVGLSGEESV